MQASTLDGMGSLLEAPAPAVLTTSRLDGTALASPVWFRYTGDTFEVVIAEGDVKLRHLERDPRAALVVFEAVRPFRGVEARGTAELVRGDVREARRSIASRYLGHAAGERFAAARAARPGVLVCLRPDAVRIWDLAAILPD
jgi:PPOX class probable F420-dependent enzyme